MARINFEFHDGTEKYSDGDIENYILTSVQEKIKDEDIIKNNPCWATYYHFSRDRENLLSSINFSKEESVLEIGSGCGALTGFFLKKCSSVTAVEISKRRSQITYERYKDHENLEVISGDLKNVELNEKFDIVTSIGVLEYAQFIYDRPDAHVEFLKKCKSRLRQGGRFIIAIENKLGLKYWAGAREDHTGKFFDSIMGYQDSKVKTFSRNELTNILREAGFSEFVFYYPYPDYKFCSQVFSDNYLPKVNQLCYDASPNYDSPRFLLYNERLVSNELIKSNLIKDFMNSFLVVAK